MNGFAVFQNYLSWVYMANPRPNIAVATWIRRHQGGRRHNTRVPCRVASRQAQPNVLDARPEKSRKKVSTHANALGTGRWFVRKHLHTQTDTHTHTPLRMRRLTTDIFTFSLLLTFAFRQPGPSPRRVCQPSRQGSSPPQRVAASSPSTISPPPA